MTSQLANPKKHPVHKANLLSARVSAELNKKHPEPMNFMHKRQKNVDLGLYDPQRGATLGQIEKAASAMAAWENSDPFAYGRTALHVRQGYLRSDEVVKEMTMRTIARRAAKVKEVEDAKSHKLAGN